jgi:hypothetical protein
VASVEEAGESQPFQVGEPPLHALFVALVECEAGELDRGLGKHDREYHGA